MDAICNACDIVKEKCKNDKEEIDEKFGKIGNETMMTETSNGPYGMKDFQHEISELRNKKPFFFRPVDIHHLKISLFKAMIMPEFAKGKYLNHTN